MKNFLKFLLIYIIVLASISSLYINTNIQYQTKLSITNQELLGVEYLNNLYNISINLALYQEFLELDADKTEIDESIKTISKYLNNIYLLQEKSPSFKNISLNQEFEKIKDSQLNTQDFYTLADLINQENYRIGDASGLLFEEDRKTYFLGTLSTHYMPEFLVSILIVHNIVEEFKYKKTSSDFKKTLFLEQNKLMELSTEELATIIGLIQPYEETQELSSLIKEIENEQKLLDIETHDNLFWDKNDEEIQTYLEKTYTILGLSYALNDEYMRLLQSSLEHRRASLEEKISHNHILFIFLILLITVILFYMYHIYSLNLKKDNEIKKNSEALDKLVIFSKTDTQGRIVYLSSALETLSGFTRDELIGKTHQLFRHEDMPEFVYDNLWETITAKKVWTGELKNRRKDGSGYWVRATITPELDSKGNITGYHAYREDISDQKELEVEKAKTQEALEFKSKFLSNMSHEIRTPLNGVISLVHLLLKTDLNTTQNDLLQKVRSASNILLGVINDILDISKIESGKMKIEKSDFDLKNTVQHVYDMLLARAQEQDIKLNLDFDNIKNFHRIGDSLRISQVLTNLIGNAIKFTSEGEVSVIIKNIGEDLVRFEVKDTGIGMKEDEMMFLFQEFMQADMSTSRKFGGTGLGLSISKNLVELMDGKIFAHSEFGKGSTFSFELPLKLSLSQDDTLEGETQNLQDLEDQVNAIEGVNILVAEDNKMNQMILEMLLENSKLNIEFALDGEIALNMYKENNYDLILMDIQMPHMNGYEATKEIRKIDKDIPIVALSANVMEEDIQRSLESGMNNHLAKPIEMDKLYTVILEYLQKQEIKTDILV